jgi:PEP-CTERM motif-containing protein
MGCRGTLESEELMRKSIAWIVALGIASSVVAQEPAKAPTQSQQRIPIRKDTKRVDTVRVTVIRVDTIRVTDTITVYMPAESPFTTLLAKTDTLRDTTSCGFVPIPIPIPFSRPADHPSTPADHPNAPTPFIVATVTPEPATVFLLATGLVGLAIVARRKR